MTSNLVVRLAAALMKGLLEIAAPLFAYYQGRKNKESSIVKEEAKVIKKQRDNNVNSLDDARKRMRMRRDKRK